MSHSCRRERLPRIGIFDHVSLRLGGSQLVVAHMAETLSREYSVEIVHSGLGYSLPALEDAFEVDLSLVKQRIVKDSLRTFSPPGLRTSLLRQRLAADRELTEPYDLFIYSGHGAPPFCYAGRGLIYCHFPFERHPGLDLPRTEGWEERGVAGRWLRMLAYSQLWNWRMRGYQSVLANSIFTSNWIARYWRSSSEVLYPPVAIKSDAVPKSNTIVSLGRFIAHDSKNHALQLKAFREFLSSHGGDWHLCLIGFCTNLPEDLAYLEKLREEAKEMPVTFLANASRDNLWNRLADAKLYWHVTALGEGDGHHPERMEHFGISTVEAMGAGCIPLVPRSGGQPEIVRHGIDGFLCDDLQSLVQYTSHLADDESLFQQMSRSAQARSKIFRPEKFSQRLIELVADALSHEGGKPLSVHETSTASLVHPR